MLHCFTTHVMPVDDGAVPLAQKTTKRKCSALQVNSNFLLIGEDSEGSDGEAEAAAAAFASAEEDPPDDGNRVGVRGRGLGSSSAAAALAAASPQRRQWR